MREVKRKSVFIYSWREERSEADLRWVRRIKVSGLFFLNVYNFSLVISSKLGKYGIVLNCGFLLIFDRRGGNNNFFKLREYSNYIRFNF